MSVLYNAGNVPYGSRVVALKKKDGSARGNVVCENINLTRPGKVTNRPNELGEPNGWVLVKDQPTGTTVMQSLTATTLGPELGDYFEENFIQTDTTTTERWVITNVGQIFENTGYWKCNVNIQIDPDKHNYA